MSPTRGAWWQSQTPRASTVMRRKQHSGRLRKRKHTERTVEKAGGLLPAQIGLVFRGLVLFGASVLRGQPLLVVLNKNGQRKVDRTAESPQFRNIEPALSAFTFVNERLCLSKCQVAITNATFVCAGFKPNPPWETPIFYLR